MRTFARLGTTTVAGVALAAAIAGCSSGSPDSSDAPAAASTAPVSSAPAITSAAASRPLSDFADEPVDPGRSPTYSFATPSRQIQCRVVEGSLACQTDEHPHTVADGALCGFYPGEEQGRARRFGFLEQRATPCATIIQGDRYDSPHTLAYGDSVSVELSAGRSVTCTSAVDGLTCTQAGGTGQTGFFLSADAFTVF
ncbi:hypothetical protein [Mycolicibacterium sediminis]|uniref:Lipoprotein LppI n=1 Tax=Mycolicibacterium sediminis TaxID=1286180 RepID=A0A7I7QUZ9_9MYCO|nr:hypothetical protein [Mycolicibacterium sediminis]BBY29807.1 hypothetical protein MSEDJ_39030 [Mycolicibacterium sediminis]